MDQKVKLKQPKTPLKLQKKQKNMSGELTKCVGKVAIKAKDYGTKFL